MVIARLRLVHIVAMAPASPLTLVFRPALSCWVVVESYFYPLLPKKKGYWLTQSIQYGLYRGEAICPILFRLFKGVASSVDSLVLRVENCAACRDQFTPQTPIFQVSTII